MASQNHNGNERRLAGLRIKFFVTEDWYFISHRRDLALALKHMGAEIDVGCHLNSTTALSRGESIRYENIPFKRSLKNPLRDIFNCLKLFQSVRRDDPDIVHLVALKPIVSSLLAVWANPRARFVHAFAGMGYLFSTTDRSARLIRATLITLLKLTLKPKNSYVLVQNLHDAEMLTNLGVTSKEKIRVIKGSGIDCDTYLPTSNSKSADQKIVLLVARMIKDKGIIEFVEAAKILKNRNLNVHFQLVGPIDRDNPAALNEALIRQWEANGLVEWCGQQQDLRPYYANASIVCLPSYREGLPKVLLEAAACGLPLIATKVPGCIEICRNEESGLTVPPRDIASLVEALERMLRDESFRASCGRRARAIAAAEFSLPIIAQQTAQYYLEKVAQR